MNTAGIISVRSTGIISRADKQNLIWNALTSLLTAVMIKKYHKKKEQAEENAISE